MPTSSRAPRRTSNTNELFWDRRYRTEPWLGSGRGSRGIAQAFKARLLKSAIQQNVVSSIADVGCGDLCWLRTDVVSPRDLANVRYCGLDISSVVVDANRERFPTLDFRRYDLVDEPLPRGFDLVLCFDVLIHQTTVEQFTLCLRNLLAGVQGTGLVSYSNPEGLADEATLQAGRDIDGRALPKLRQSDLLQEAEFAAHRKRAQADRKIPTCPTANHGPLPSWVNRISPDHRVRHVADYRYQSLYALDLGSSPLDLPDKPPRCLT